MSAKSVRALQRSIEGMRADMLGLRRELAQLRLNNEYSKAYVNAGGDADGTGRGKRMRAQADTGLAMASALRTAGRAAPGALAAPRCGARPSSAPTRATRAAQAQVRARTRAKVRAGPSRPTAVEKQAQVTRAIDREWRAALSHHRVGRQVACSRATKQMAAAKMRLGMF